MTTTFSFGTVPGLTGEEQRQLTELTEAYNYHQSRNATKDKYYEGHVTLQDVNLGIALPKGLNKLEVGCNWGQKAVDALASRSMFDGFVSNSGALDGLQKLVDDNRLIAAYAKACRDQLKYGCVFATLSADTDIAAASASTPLPRPPRSGTARRGASTAALPSSTQYRTSTKKTAGGLRWSTSTPTLPSSCCAPTAAAGRRSGCPTGWVVR